MSIVKCKVLDYIEIYIYAKVWNVKALFFVPNAQISIRLLSNVKLKFPDDDTRGGEYDSVLSET